jgi:hypothetical protein
MPVDDLTIAFFSQFNKGHSNLHLAIIRRLLSMDSSEAPRLDIHLIVDEPLRQETASLPTWNYHMFAFHSTGDTDYSTKRVDENPSIR